MGRIYVASELSTKGEEIRKIEQADAQKRDSLSRLTALLSERKRPLPPFLEGRVQPLAYER